MPQSPDTRPNDLQPVDNGSVNTALLVKALGAFFAIMNPFVNLPIFLSLTAGQDPGRQRRTALRTLLFSTMMCAVVVLTGSRLLGFFGVSVDAFRVAGGLVLLTIALGMLSGRGSSAHEGSQEEKSHHATVNDIAFYPMTFPMIVGPGTITTIVVIDAQAHGLPERLTVALALIGILVMLGVVLFFSAQIGAHLSMTLRTVMTRLMGMMLASIAVEMLTVGLAAVLPGLAH